jgi:hypothetical protein
VAGRVRTLAGLSLLVFAGPGWAADPAPADSPPSAELLLFLVEFQDARGNEVDPIALAEQSAGDAATKTARPADSKAPAKKADDRDEPRHVPRR